MAALHPQLLVSPAHCQTATLAMGCFWGTEALFGAQQGVLRTRVGYAGGTTDSPSYRQMGDHLETLQLDFDPEQIPYEQLLTLFFQHHNASRAPWKRQYASALFYHNPKQEMQIRRKIEERERATSEKIQTEVLPYQQFYLAEDRHQKYKLQRQPLLLAEFRKMYPKPEDFINATATTRVNGYLAGRSSTETILQEFGSLGLSAEAQRELLQASIAVANPAWPGDAANR